MINRVLLPGGSTFFNHTNGYAESGAYVYKIAKRLNDNGIHFPLFGICLGFELLLYISNKNEEYRTSCSSTRQALPLNFTKGERATFDYRIQFLIGNFSHFNYNFFFFISKKIINRAVCLVQYRKK